MFRKRPLVKYIIKRFNLAGYISRLQDICTEISDEKLGHFESARIAHELLRRFQLFESAVIAFRRYGNKGDGGYVVVDDLSPTDSLLTIGVGNDISFESDLADSLKRIHFYDHTVNELPVEVAGGLFFKIGIASNGSREFCTLREALTVLSPEADCILKMDVEFSEWEILESVSSKELNSFRQIIIELHGLNEIQGIKHRNRIFSGLDKLLTTHVPVHIHPNNYESNFSLGGFSIPKVIEVTFLRRDAADLMPSTPPRGQFFDSSNNASRPDIPFPRYFS